jgi:PiT family inorganic phosphate transporter
MLNGAQDVGKVLGVSSRGAGRRGVLDYVYYSLIMATGAVILGSRISRTLAKGIVDFTAIELRNSLTVGSISALTASILIASFALVKKLPVSISQLVVGGITGAGIALGGFKYINTHRLLIVVSSWFITPLLATVLSITLYFINEYVSRHYSPRALFTLHACYLYTSLLLLNYFILSEVVEPGLSITYSLIISLSTVALITLPTLARKHHVEERVEFVKTTSHVVVTLLLALSLGAHDIGNAAGPLSIGLQEVMGVGDRTMRLALLASAAGFAIGAIIWGYRIAETVGGRITPLTPETSLVVQLSTGLTILVLIWMGIPTSITLAVIGSIAGVGYARGLKYVNTKLFLEINLVWLLGVPFTALLSFSIASLVKLTS